MLKWITCMRANFARACSTCSWSSRPVRRSPDRPKQHKVDPKCERQEGEHHDMQRFKQGDRVFVLPKFAHLYPGDSGIVRSVRIDPFRSVFNSYEIEFGGGATATAFEFQIVENPANYQTVVGTVVFDSRLQMANTRARGRATSAQIVFEADGFDLDITIRPDQSSKNNSLIGQILEKSTARLLKNIEASLMREGMPIGTTTSDQNGVFKFSNVPSGPLNILITIPQHSIRFFAAFTI